MQSLWTSNDVSCRSNDGNFLVVGVFFLMATFVHLNHGYVHTSPHNAESNEISAAYSEWKIIPKDDHLPRCHPESICASLQTNAKGVHVTQLCRCRGPHRCSRHWDPFDGHSITQGSEQYKFCEKAPILSTCSPREIAYTSVMGYSKVTNDLVSTTDRILCKCPEMFNYEAADHSYNDLDGEVNVFKAEYLCQRMPQCKPMETCKAVSETSENFLVNPKCVCPENLFCPTVTNHEIESMAMGKGRVYLIRCQEIN